MKPPETNKIWEQPSRKHHEAAWRAVAVAARLSWRGSLWAQRLAKRYFVGLSRLHASLTSCLLCSRSLFLSKAEISPDSPVLPLSTTSTRTGTTWDEPLLSLDYSRIRSGTFGSTIRSTVVPRQHWPAPTIKIHLKRRNPKITLQTSQRKRNAAGGRSSAKIDRRAVSKTIYPVSMSTCDTMMI
jgi:hypothetical protein